MNTDQKIKEHEEAIKALKLKKDSEVKWVKVGYKQIPKSLFVKYGLQPFEIQKRKFNAQKKAKKLGYRLPDMREMLMLLEFYKRNKKISIHDKEFLGIEELSYDEDVSHEWIEGADAAFVRGGDWDHGADAGVFTLNLNNAPSHSYDDIGFRCVR